MQLSRVLRGREGGRVPYSLGYGGNLPVGGRNNFVHMNFRKNAILEAFPCVSRPNILKTIKEEKFKDGNVIYLQATM